MKKFDSEFIKKVFKIALPVALHEFLFASFSLVDNLMISRVNSVSIAGVQLANQMFFLYYLFMVGITSGSAVFVAQFFGDKNIEGVRKTVGFTLVLSSLCSFAFLAVSYIFPDKFLSFYTTDKAVIEIGSSYLVNVALAYFFSGITRTYSTTLRSMKFPKLPMYAVIFSIILNTTLNYILIFGKLGFKPMGAPGAAIATTIARFTETAILLIAVYATKNPVACGLRELFKFDLVFARKILKTSSPVILNEIGWATGVSFFNKMYATVGTAALTAITISDTITYFFIVFFFGTSSAAAAILGNDIGADSNRDAILFDGKRILSLVFFIAVPFGIVQIYLGTWALNLYKVETSILYTARELVVISAFLLPFKVNNLHMVNGLMRSGGDTGFAMFLDIFGVWGIGVPISVYCVYFLKTPIEILYIAISVEEILKTVLGLYRINSGKWIKKLV